MKILRVVSDLYPAVVGGIGIHAHQMSSGQARLGNEVMVFTISPDRFPKVGSADGYTVERFPVYFRLCGNSFAPGLIREILRVRKNFDIIHAHSHLFFSTNICVFARLLRSAPLIVTNHGLISASAPPWLNTLYTKTVSKATFRIADRIICYTDIERDNIVKLGINPDKISVIHNGVDTVLFSPKRTAKNPDRKQILWVGRYVPGKGLEYLVEAFSRVRERIPSAHLVLVGDGPEKQKIGDLIQKSGLSGSVTRIDHLDNSDLPRLYNKSDAFVLPSLMEGVPRTLLEAMACGIPAVITDLPHLRKIVDGAGLQVPVKDSHRLSEAILSILNDTDLAERMGRAGRSRIERDYSWEDTVKKTLAVYDQVIADHNQTGKLPGG